MSIHRLTLLALGVAIAGCAAPEPQPQPPAEWWQGQLVDLTHPFDAAALRRQIRPEFCRWCRGNRRA